MPFFEAPDETALHYLDWDDDAPIVFSHGWALGGDTWDYQMLPLSERGFRYIAHDRRGCGRSDQPGHGYDADTFADDLAALLDHDAPPERKSSP